MKDRKTSLRVALAVNKMYAKLAEKAAIKAAKCIEDGYFETAEQAAARAEKYAKRAGGNALCWGLL